MIWIGTIQRILLIHKLLEGFFPGRSRELYVIEQDIRKHCDALETLLIKYGEVYKKEMKCA